MEKGLHLYLYKFLYLFLLVQIERKSYWKTVLMLLPAWTQYKEEWIPRHSGTCLIDFEKENMGIFRLLSRNVLKEKEVKI